MHLVHASRLMFHNQAGYGTSITVKWLSKRYSSLTYLELYYSGTASLTYGQGDDRPMVT